MALPLWVPGYTRVDLGPDGGAFDETSHPKGCLHTTEGSTLRGAESAFKDYPPHLGYDPTTRTKHQYVSLNHHSYALRGSESDDEFVIQIEIVGFASQTQWWAQTIYNNIAKDVIKPLEDLVGIPRKALKFYGEDAGFPLAVSDSPIRLSPGSLRNYRGWLGHQHIPTPDVHWDPGKFQIQKCFNAIAAIEHPTPPPVEKESQMIEFVRGDSKQPAPEGTPYGYRVFKVDWLNSTSEWVRGVGDTPVLNAEYQLWKACGNQDNIVPQAIIDNLNEAYEDAQ